MVAGADCRSIIGRWPLPGAGWIATISYSLYLSHKIIFHLVQVNLVHWMPRAGLLHMVELSSIELTGKLLRLPYWSCAGTKRWAMPGSCSSPR